MSSRSRPQKQDYRQLSQPNKPRNNDWPFPFPRIEKKIKNIK